MPEAVRPVRPVRLCCVRCGNDLTNHDLFLTIHDLTDHALRLPIHDLTNHDLSLTIHDLSTRVWRLTLHDLTNHDLAIHVQPSPLPRLYWAKLRRQSAAASGGLPLVVSWLPRLLAPQAASGKRQAASGSWRFVAVCGSWRFARSDLAETEILEFQNLGVAHLHLWFPTGHF